MQISSVIRTKEELMNFYFAINHTRIGMWLVVCNFYMKEFIAKKLE